MSKVLTDNKYYTEIASAIRSKAGVSSTYKPSEMASAIEAIPSGKTPVLQDITITSNGTYTASTGYDGFGTVVANVSSGGSEYTGMDLSYFCQNYSTITSYIDDNSEVYYMKPYAFYQCTALTNVSFPICSYIGNYAFCNCNSLASAFIPNCSCIGSGAFYSCSSLTAIYINNYSGVCSLLSSNVFSNCSNLASIYVHPDWVESYKMATTWSDYSDKIIGSAYTE